MSNYNGNNNFLSSYQNENYPSQSSNQGILTFLLINVVVPIDFVPLHQIRENIDPDPYNLDSKRNYALNNFEPLSLTPLNPQEIAIEGLNNQTIETEESQVTPRKAKSTVITTI